MSTCKQCGKEYSILTARGLGTGLCNDCVAANQAEEDRHSFACLIPNRPLTGIEQIGVGIMTLGLMEKQFRPASAKIINRQLKVSAYDTGGSKVDLGDVSFEAVTSVKLHPLDTARQMQSLLIRSLIIWLVVTFVLCLIVGGKIGWSDLSDRYGGVAKLVMVSAAIAAVLVGIFNFAPGMARLKPLWQITLEKKDGQVSSLALLLDSDQKIQAVDKLKTIEGLTVENVESTNAV